MTDEVDIIEYEDPSVKNLLNKTAEELHKKYSRQRKINERFLNKKTPAKKATATKKTVSKKTSK